MRENGKEWKKAETNDDCVTQDVNAVNKLILARVYILQNTWQITASENFKTCFTTRL